MPDNRRSDSSRPDQQTMRSIAENVQLRAAHQILTVIGVPILLGISGWGLNAINKMSDQLIAANERLAVVETLKPRIERLESMADLRGPVYPLTDGRNLEREVNRIDGRVTALEQVFR